MVYIMKKTGFCHLLTEEGEAFLSSHATPWSTYPRPLLQRDSFFCLNGHWDFSDSAEGELKETILVPFPPESVLSGIGRSMGQNPTVRYRRTFTLPEDFRPAYPHKVLLHFGAVDQIASVTLNGKLLGDHAGGYEGFSFDVTAYLTEGENTLCVTARDELRRKILPYGKQREDRGGMWYTPVTGIWQTVWMECVPEKYVRAVTVKTDLTSAEITVDGIENGSVLLETPDGTSEYPITGGRALIPIENPRLWCPEDPYLYRFTIVAGAERVRSYFALRTLEIKDIDGLPRLCLNGQPIYLHALLDQGYFSDGIFTPASPVCYEKDIMSAKSLGFNTLRKHIKVEPQQFYYDCDRLGMLVMQDMVNNGHYSFLRDTALPTVGMKRVNDRLLHRNKETRLAFENAMESTVKELKDHPSVIYWTIFNEGWGQFDGDAMYEKLLSLDHTRFIDTASGWFSHRGMRTHVESLHVYFKPVKIKAGPKPVVLSEFGGYVYKVADHSFNREKTYGYGSYKTRQEFEDALISLYDREIIPAIKEGLSGSVYTQITDVEDETNGLFTYDRKVCKVDSARMLIMAEKLKI